jgi:inosine/xanthosine triphosphate pyrophosphatase family protein
LSEKQYFIGIITLVNSVIFSTGNWHKAAHATEVCIGYDIDLIQKELEIDEIQSEDGEKIVIDKANKAFEILNQPVVVSDDSWSITGLNGFPGAYMKSMNHWLSVDDFLRLTENLENRQIFMIGYLAYKDKDITKVFRQKREAHLMKEAKGKGHSSGSIISMKGDNGLSINEVYTSDISHKDREVAKVWHEFADWYRNYKKLPR